MSEIKTLSTVIERPGEAAFREVTLTPKRADTVVCRTRMSAISTGTDMKTYHGMQHPEQCWYPLVPGYENIGPPPSDRSGKIFLQKKFENPKMVGEFFSLPFDKVK